MTQPNETLAELYLRECGGDKDIYRGLLTQGFRLGQAFFNALSEKDKALIRATPRDMFYLDGRQAQIRIEEAIDWLLDRDRSIFNVQDS